jgi:hypothetical protein
VRWRIEGTDGLAIGDIGWCKDPFTTPSTIKFAKKGDAAFQCPTWAESWFPDAFIGTMAQLLIAIEDRTRPAVSGEDNLRTLALVAAACESATSRQVIELDGASLARNPQHKSKVARLFGKLEAFFGSALEEDRVNLTPRAQQVLVLSRKEAERLNHEFIGTEHLLLGLIRLGQGTALDVLTKQGLDLDKIRREIEQFVGETRSEAVRPQFPYTPRVRKVLALAKLEAKDLKHAYVGTEHLLLGLLLEEDGVAGRVLRNSGISVAETRKRILAELSPPGPN